ncbi:DUF1501 domain-containing protein [Pseudomonas sp. Irchel 3A7]|uniref:DUF1501 domain-containing protein n=1 Tax=Pseudomonas sp. Irchel 3A7 TaxID=2008913 RepID=UPI000BA3776A|nr:DUF1501 domain-containing protein [Pseudomonas sp. Irchel 3A7]
MNRRGFCKLFGAVGSYSLFNSSFAALPSGSSDSKARLVVVMLRGAVDGLSILIPHAEINYYRLREKTAIALSGMDGGMHKLNSTFGLHPALSSLVPLWHSGQLAFIPASGCPSETRSHFSAQFNMECGIPDAERSVDGWMNRLAVENSIDLDEMNAVSFGATVTQILSGKKPIAVINSQDNYGTRLPVDRTDFRNSLASLYSQNPSLHHDYIQGLKFREEIIKSINTPELDKEALMANNGAAPPTLFSRDVHLLSSLINTQPDFQFAFMQLSGWDTHVNQGGAKGVLATNLSQLSYGLSLLPKLLGDNWRSTTVVVMSEFGRTAKENSTGGTDHGHGNVMMVLGGNVGGGKIYGEWPGLSDDVLFQQRDVAITTDFRHVLSHICQGGLKLSDNQLSAIFPRLPDFPATSLKGLING